MANRSFDVRCSCCGSTREMRVSVDRRMRFEISFGPSPYNDLKSLLRDRADLLADCGLSKREIEVIKLWAIEDMGSKEVAKALSENKPVSTKTVDVHLVSIRKKLGIASKMQAFYKLLSLTPEIIGDMKASMIPPSPPPAESAVARRAADGLKNRDAEEHGDGE